MFCALPLKLMYRHLNKTLRSNAACVTVFSVSVCVYYCDIHDSAGSVRPVRQIALCVQQKCDGLSHMKIGIGMCHVTEETAQSIIIIIVVTIIILLLLSSSSLPTRSALLSRHQHAVNDGCFFLRERLYM
jgi:hypothetical protein